MKIILLVIFGIINVLIAHKKGYSKTLWFFAAGLLGLIILIFLPNTHDKKYNVEKSEALVNKGDNIAIIIISVAVCITAIVLLLRFTS